MDKHLPLSLLLAATLAGCTSMRVSGMVYDSISGDPIGSCGITIGTRYSHVDSAGHYSVKARSSWKTMTLVAPGYETQTVTVDSSTRYPNMNIPMVPKAPDGLPGRNAAKK